MKQIHTKQTSKKKIVIQKRITSKNTKRNSSPMKISEICSNLQSINELLLYSDSNSSKNVLIDERQKHSTFEIPVKFHNSESGFTITSSTISNNSQEPEFTTSSNTMSNSDQSTSQQIERVNEFTQIIIEDEINFIPMTEKYGSYFKNFTKMLFFI
ncbi:5445_t:CDS:1 [Funneliformis caledonium]|uniref:5445_t:CDS:1 n=1 Tax=Funneliformis caledonium TaxID=1117310 RepID=A0A9N9HXJ4_9GLOM|nr:5445_t:CDS:1 [Funneliformis caledonium]